ncbi:MAG: hypothetical protein RI939_1491, partial [Actinomycetota bacterium]
ISSADTGSLPVAMEDRAYLWVLRGWGAI